MQVLVLLEALVTFIFTTLTPLISIITVGTLPPLPPLLQEEEEHWPCQAGLHHLQRHPVVLIGIVVQA